MTDEGARCALSAGHREGAHRPAASTNHASPPAS
jgi:hypothetical protein